MASDFEHVHTSPQGVDWSMREDDKGRLEFKATHDLAPLIERNKTAQTHINGYTPSKDYRLAATIPASVRLHWLVTEGWDCLSGDPGCMQKLAQKLDSSDWRHLRCAEFKIGNNWRNSGR